MAVNWRFPHSKAEGIYLELECVSNETPSALILQDQMAALDLEAGELA